MASKKLYYNGTDIDVRLGDQIEYRKIFKKVRGEVVYLPGQSEENKNMGADVWCVQLVDEPYDVRSMGYFPDQAPYALKRISFLGRGEGRALIEGDETIE